MTSAASAQVVRIATRKSPLALWQAHHVKGALEVLHPGVRIDILGFTTQGDKLLDASLAKVGGKGLFVKELEAALLEDRADIAVHSMKDVPVDFPAGLELAVICAREDPCDAFVSNGDHRLADLPAGSCVGTSSLRRQCQLRSNFPHLRIVELRGNVNTRLARLDQGEYDGIILATAGLMRLGMATRIREKLPIALSLPAGGQGALGIECRASDDRVRQLIAPLHHIPSALCVSAERAVNRRLQGGCEVPVASYAELDMDNKMHLRALVGSPDGQRILREDIRGPGDAAESLGQVLAERLLGRGAGHILAALHGR